MSTIQLFDNASSAGPSSAFSVNGVAIVKASGTFGGATVHLESKSNDSNDSFSQTGDAFTSDFAKELKTVTGISYRLNIVGTPTSINAFVANAENG
jgi:hypothetical protein